MDDDLEAVLAPHSPAVRALAEAARALVRAVFPEAVEQPDQPARLIGYGFDRTYKGLVCGIALNKASAAAPVREPMQHPDNG